MAMSLAMISLNINKLLLLKVSKSINMGIFN